MQSRACVIALWCCLAAWSCARGAENATAPADKPAPARPGVLVLPAVRVDLAARSITIEAEVCENPAYMLEFLLCRHDTKEYESLLRTKAQAAHLHAALLALGLAPGRPAQWSSADPDAKFLPPRGAELKITFRWKNAKGVQQADAGRWLAKPEGKAQPPPEKWVFVGSEVLPDGRYWADLEGEGGIISVANLASAVIDVPFESTAALDEREFVPDKRMLPPAGTAVEVIITPLPGAERADYARALLEIDSLGQTRIDGRPVDLQGVEQWARDYLAAHAKGQVIVRAEAEALVEDLRRTREVLEMAGVRDIAEIYLPADMPLLPRTSRQLDLSLEQWRERFAQPGRFIADPLQLAEATLEQIRLRALRQQETDAIWSQYARQLSRMLQAYKASTQPAAPSGPAAGDNDPPAKDPR